MDLYKLTDQLEADWAVAPWLSKKIIAGFLEAIRSELTECGATDVPGLGRFEQRVSPPVMRRDVVTGEAEAIETQVRIGFVADLPLKRRVGASTTVTRQTPARALEVHYDTVHRTLWEHCDDVGHRVTFRMADWAPKFGLTTARFRLVMLGLAREGRIRVLGRKGMGTHRYQVADPDRYDRADPATHAQRATTPQWG